MNSTYSDISDLIRSCCFFVANQVQLQRKVLWASLFLLALLSISILPVSAAAPVAAFSGTPTSGTLPFTVSFTDLSTGSPTSWAWFFGDENFTAPWTQANASAGWTARYYHSSVVMPDGSIVLMGGKDSIGYKNDTWRSTNNGVTWTLVNASSKWTKRYGHSSVAMPDGSIILMGGYYWDGSNDHYLNDTWRSTDNGNVWTRMNASAGWSVRDVHSSIAMPDGSIVLMGGYDGVSVKNDTWRSTDNGNVWTRMNASAGWASRSNSRSVAMPDGSIVLMGGNSGSTYYHDVWRSTDNGATWTLVNASAEWSARQAQSSVAMPDGSIVLMGGFNGLYKNDVWQSTDNGNIWTNVTASAGPGWTARYGHTSLAMPNGSIVLMGGLDSSYQNDVWRFIPTGSSAQNPSHTYTAAGNYQVALQAYNTGGYNSTRKTGYITVTSGSSAPVASFTSNVTTGTSPLAVQFNDTSTNTPTTWNWSFGDGTWFNTTSSALANVTHTFPTAAGTYTVNLTAGNSAGSNISSRTNYITVTAPKIFANFTGTPTSGTAPFPVSFTDSSTSGATGWAWFFGDENYTAPWTSMNTSSGWSARYAQSSVAMPDGSIVLMGGYGGSWKNDTWRSTDNGAHWILMNGSSGWSTRNAQSSVAMPDGSIILTGGTSSGVGDTNDVWRSTDNGATWSRQNASAGWSIRDGHSSVAMPDGSIVLMGGEYGSNYKNDVWRSTDNGIIWTNITTSGGWSGRYAHTSVAMPDGSIVLMGGYNGSYTNDTWRSTNNGATWTVMNVSSGWMARYLYDSVAMPDGSIVLMGGNAGSGSDHYKNDVWLSKDYGATWTQTTSAAGWVGREDQSTVAMRDGSIVIMGGLYASGYLNDTYRLNPVGSSLQNPSHTYTSAGVFQVALQAFNSAGYNSTRKTGYITVTGSSSAPVANLNGTPTSGTAPLTVQFMDDSTNSPTIWNWSFGDGSLVHADWQDPNHTYTSAGTYTVSLNATNSGGSNTSTRTNYITVSSSVFTPVASFSGTPTSGLLPLTVSFTDGSLNTTGWAWFFGDENFTAPWTEVNPSAGWSARYGHTSVAMPDGSIVMMGGYNGSRMNDVWRSTNNGATWTQQTASAEWSARYYHSSVAMPDGSIILMGGSDSGSYKNDVWRSTNNGASWTQMTAGAGAEWSARKEHSSVAMPDGSILLMGGWDNGDTTKNDVWLSKDNGASWTSQTASAGWSARDSHSSVAMPDGSIVLMGGWENDTIWKKDVWRSTNNGSTWTQMTAGAGAEWSARYYHSSVAMPDGSIILLGGYTGGLTNDVWRSTDNGAIWTEVNASAGWSQRYAHTSVSMPDGSIILMGGADSGGNKNDVWRFMPAGSSLQNPSHTYTLKGSYQVALQAFNTGGYNSTRKTGYITITTPTPVASFTTNITNGTVPFAVQFTDTSTGSPTSWNWNFGDANSSTEQNPVHTFVEPKVFDVTLKATNLGGSNTSIKQITGYATKVETTTAMNGTTESIVNGNQVLSVNTTTIESTGGSVTTTNTTVTVTDGNTFWENTQLFAENVALNTTTGDYTVTNMTQVVMQSAPVSVALNESVGTVSVSLDVALKQYVSDAPINITITQGATTNTVNKFELAAQNSNIDIKEIAYTVQFTNTESINANLTQNTTRQSQAVILTMNVKHSWVARFANSTNNDGRGSIAILRYPEIGDPKVLTTRFDHYNSTTGVDWFEGDSPDGLSIFGMIGYAAQEASTSQSSGNTGNVGDTSSTAVNQQATSQIFKETAPLQTDTSKQLAADVNIQSIDKIALLTLSRGIRATDTFGQTLAEVSVLPMDNSMVPPPETGSQYTFGGLAYHCRPDHAQFSQPVTLSFTLSQDQWNTLHANNKEPIIRTFSTSTNAWESLPTITDPAARTVSTSVTHFSDFAIFSEPVPNNGTSTVTPVPTPKPSLTSKPGLTVIAGNPSPTTTTAVKTSKPPANALEIMAGLGLWGSGLIMNNPLIAVIGIIVIGIGYVGWVQYRKKKEHDLIMYAKRK